MRFPGSSTSAVGFRAYKQKISNNSIKTYRASEQISIQFIWDSVGPVLARQACSLNSDKHIVCRCPGTGLNIRQAYSLPVYFGETCNFSNNGKYCLIKQIEEKDASVFQKNSR